MHVIMSLFETNETSRQNMAIQFESLFSKFGLMHCVIAFVKNKGNNLTTMAYALCYIIGLEPLKLIKFYESTYFKRVMSKVF
jgi:hypothetical protein